MSFFTEQSGGSVTPYPLRYFKKCNGNKQSGGNPTQCGGNPTQCGGNPTPLPLRYFNPNSTVRHNCFGCQCNNPNVVDLFYRSNYARQTAKEIAQNPDNLSNFGCQCAMKQSQMGGGPVGAPFTIPNYGLNQDIGQSKQASSEETTGFSYRFNTKMGCPSFCGQYGYNLPSFHPVLN